MLKRLDVQKTMERKDDKKDDKNKNESNLSVSLDFLPLILEIKSKGGGKCSNLYFSAVKIDLSVMRTSERVSYTM